MEVKATAGHIPIELLSALGSRPQRNSVNATPSSATPPSAPTDTPESSESIENAQVPPSIRGLVSSSTIEPQAAPADARAVQVDADIQAARAAGAGPTPSADSALPVTVTSADAQPLRLAPGSAHTSSTQLPLASDAEGRNAAMMVRGIKTLVNQHGGAMTMRLDPPELGHVRIEMSIVRGVVTASFQAAAEPARELLQQTLPMLRHALEQQGLAVDRLTLHGSPSTQGAAAAPSRELGHAQSQSGQHDSQNQQSTRHDAGGGESRGRRDQPGEERAPSRRPASKGPFAQMLEPSTR
jgi:flagellar hook-length control protein FliK